MVRNSSRLGFVLVGSLALVTLGVYAVYARAGTVRHAAWTPPAVAAAAAAAIATEPEPVAAAIEAPVAPGKPAIAAGDGVRLATRVDRGAVLHGSDGLVHVEVKLSAEQTADGEHARAPSDMLVVLDISGSMNGQKLDYAKQALRELVDRLSSSDRFGLVTYDSEAELALPLQAATPRARASFRQVIDALQTRGGTNMSAGLDLGIEQLARSRAHGGRSARVLLLSDGQANEGDSTPAGLAHRARSIVQSEHVLSAMGVGDDFNEDLMTALADAGSGNFYYLSRVETLPRFFDAELRAATQTLARSVELRFAPERKVEVLDVSGYPIERSGGVASVRPGNLYAGQERTLWVTLRVPTEALGDMPLGRLSLAYKRGDRPVELAAEALPQLACVADENRFEQTIDKELWQDYLLDEQLHKTELEIGAAIGNGSAADVDRATSSYHANRSLAEKIGADRVLQSFGWLDASAASAKSQQNAAPAARMYNAKQAKSRAQLQRRGDAYNDDPLAGME